MLGLVPLHSREMKVSPRQPPSSHQLPFYLKLRSSELASLRLSACPLTKSSLLLPFFLAVFLGTTEITLQTSGQSGSFPSECRRTDDSSVSFDSANHIILSGAAAQSSCQLCGSPGRLILYRDWRRVRGNHRGSGSENIVHLLFTEHTLLELLIASHLNANLNLMADVGLVCRCSETDASPLVPASSVSSS